MRRLAVLLCAISVLAVVGVALPPSLSGMVGLVKENSCQCNAQYRLNAPNEA